MLSYRLLVRTIFTFFFEIPRNACFVCEQFIPKDTYYLENEAILTPPSQVHFKQQTFFFVNCENWCKQKIDDVRGLKHSMKLIQWKHRLDNPSQSQNTNKYFNWIWSLTKVKRTSSFILFFFVRFWMKMRRPRSASWNS